MQLSSFTPKQMSVMRSIAQEQNEKMKGTRMWRVVDTVAFLFLALMVVLAIRLFIVEPIRVEGNSMYPTLLNREHMMVEKVSYLAHAPNRGDIVICFYPGYKKSCVKRVIGLPGDRVCIFGGKVFINGEPLDETSYWTDEIFGDYPEQIVPENSFFLMGDNRNASKDSRNPTVGFIPKNKIVGHVFHIIWPLKSFRSIEGAVYN